MSSNHGGQPPHKQAPSRPVKILPADDFQYDADIHEPWKAYDVRNQLPPGWQGWVDKKNGWITYVNRAEGKAQHLHPSGRFYNEGLPLPWQRAVSLTHRVYYQNHETKEVKFDMPSGAKYVWGFGYVPINWADRRDANHDRYCVGSVFNPKL